jgi:hypothetical protein
MEEAEETVGEKDIYCTNRSSEEIWAESCAGQGGSKYRTCLIRDTNFIRKRLPWMEPRPHQVAIDKMLDTETYGTYFIYGHTFIMYISCGNPFMSEILKNGPSEC